jgi:hypothetical protein
MSTLKTNTIQTVAGKTILGSTGSVLQVAYAENTTQFDVTVQASYQVYYSVPVTAIANNSRYILDGFFTGFIYPLTTPGYARSNIGYSVTISGSTTRILGVDGYPSGDSPSGDSWSVTSGSRDSAGNTLSAGALHNRTVIYTSTAPAGTVLTFNLLAAAFDPGGGRLPLTVTLAGYGQKSAFTITEISA